MSRICRLTLLCATALALMAAPTFAQADNVPGSSPAAQQPADSAAEPEKSAPKERPAPVCPYRDGKLGLIV